MKKVGFMKFIDLTNKKFGTLIVKNRIENKIYEYKTRSAILVQYLCQCDCGKEIIKSANSLKEKNIPSCSQLCRNKFIHNDIKIGDKINDFLILDGPLKKWKSLIWICQCPCGNKLNSTKKELYSKKSCNTCNSIKQIKEYNSKNKIPHNKLPYGEANFNSIYSVYKYRANRKQLEFKLTLFDFKNLTQGNCHYCGIIPSTKPKHKTKGFTPYIHNGIDRIDSLKGYTIDNCVTCCSNCNYMKQESSIEEFKSDIVRIYKFLFKD